MTIYKAFADQEEISKITVMRKYLGMTDKDIEENFNELIREKQLVAIADYFAERISEENPPVDFKSPVRLKKDVETEEKEANNAASPSKKSNGKDGEDSGDESGDDTGEDTEEDTGDEETESDSGPEEAAEASFGLG
jgi:L-lysine 2,3-aminomutase